MLEPPLLVVMGVSGSGKTEVSALLGERLGIPSADGDAFHPPANIAKMKSGIPLGDDDRAPWLSAIGDWLDARIAARTGGIVSCSALKRAYRDQLRARQPAPRFIYLFGPKDLLAKRLETRQGHFFKANMLESQLADLEEPGADERVIARSIEASPQAIVESIVAALEVGA